jgi:repressor LexA
MALTRRQREVLDFITDFIQSKRYSPSLEEIADHFDLNSVATVHKHVSNLEKKGFIRRDWNRSRSIDVLPGAADGLPQGVGSSLGQLSGALRGASATGAVAGATTTADGGLLAFPSNRQMEGSSQDRRFEVEFPGAIEAITDAFEPEAGSGAKDLSGVVRLDVKGRVAAGLPLEVIPDGESVPVPESMISKGRCFVLQVSGESMVDEQIADGDFVIVEERSQVTDGEKVVATIDGEATVKTFHRQGDGSIRLQPANDLFEPIIVEPGAALEIRGVVIGLMRKYRP